MGEDSANTSHAEAPAMIEAFASVGVTVSMLNIGSGPRRQPEVGTTAIAEGQAARCYQSAL
jgi:hypothetical protein